MSSTETFVEPVVADPDHAPASDGPGKEWLTFEALAVIALAVALAAVAVAIFSVGLATRAIDEHRAIPAAGQTGGASVAVSLDEFTISPKPIAASMGSRLVVTNDGNVLHDLAVQGNGKTPQLDPGEQADLELTGLAAGTYVVFCQIPGHREAGMQADLIIG